MNQTDKKVLLLELGVGEATPLQEQSFRLFAPF